MFPDLFAIGPLNIHTYGLFVALGFTAGLLMTIRIGKARGIPAEKVMDMGFMVILFAIIGSRLAYVLMNFSYYKDHPMAVFAIWQGGPWMWG